MPRTKSGGFFRSRRVVGVGPSPCEICFVGEGPGYYEGQSGKPFVGKTGDELDRFLDGYNLPLREDVFLTNLYREFKGKDYIYTQADLEKDAPELHAELARVQPKILVTLGRHSTRYFLGDVDLEDVHGIPYRYMYKGREIYVFPTIHPAAGLHNTDIQSHITYDFAQLAAFLKGDLEPRLLFDDPYDGKEVYTELTTGAAVARACATIDSRTYLAIDSEGWPWAPWSIQFSIEAGRAYLIRRGSTEALAAFSRYVCARRPTIIYHNSLHDLTMNRAIGIPDTNELPFEDTMVMAYLLGIEPQGLKPLCVRHCNMKMQSYMDVLGEAGQRLALDYLVSLFDCEQVDYEEKQQAKFEEINRTPLVDKKTGQPKRDKQGHVRFRKTSVLPKLPKTRLHKAVERCLQSKDARNLWHNQVEDIEVDGYRTLGPMPEPTLDHVPYPVALHYSCRDADGTLRLYHALRPRLRTMGLG